MPPVPPTVHDRPACGVDARAGANNRVTERPVLAGASAEAGARMGRQAFHYILRAALALAAAVAAVDTIVSPDRIF